MANFGTFATSAVLAAGDLNKIGGAWTSWAPGYTNMSVGNGTVLSAYEQLGRVVIWRYKITFGSTSTMGTSPTITIPVAAATNNECESTMVYFWTGSASAGLLAKSGSTGVTPIIYQTAGTYVALNGITASVPATWATSHSLSFVYIYEASADPT